MSIQKFNLNEISEQFTQAWSPIDIETINESVIRAAKFDGKYHWHKHDDEDELFIVFKGKINIQIKGGDITLEQGEGVKIPRGLEHRPVSIEPSIVLMFEPIKLKSKGD
ncbi:MAG: cupin domain-containing protein [Candidatus Bathyarchaeota archaeon]|nr:cupin domain-containing protein [Candidatus Bathyarchaeota archaeon]